jgi:hypothetical protein
MNRVWSAPGFIIGRAVRSAQEVVRKTLTDLFTDKTSGLPGNDDLGATSAWAVFAQLGIYPENPGSRRSCAEQSDIPQCQVEARLAGDQNSRGRRPVQDIHSKCHARWKGCQQLDSVGRVFQCETVGLYLERLPEYGYGTSTAVVCACRERVTLGAFALRPLSNPAANRSPKTALGEASFALWLVSRHHISQRTDCVPE